MTRLPTILFAEDEAVIRAMLARILAQCGIRVLVAASGREAMLLFRHHLDEIDVVVLDVGLGDVEGPEALEQMRSLRADLPAILMSGAPRSPAERDALCARGVHFVAKPVRAVELARRVRELARRPE